MSITRDELARDIFLADNMNAPAGLMEAEWDGNKGDETYAHMIADGLIAAGYRKPRTITSAYQLESLPFGSAVQTSDASDVVVLRCEGNNFRNQSGYELSATDLWRYGTRPFTVLFEPEAQQ